MIENSTATQEAEPLRLIRLREVVNKTGLSKTSIYRGIAARTFPLHVRYGKASFWSAAEVDAWIRARLAERPEARA